MIENLRKYTGLIIVVFVILFISFFFLDSQSVQNLSGGRPVLKIGSRTYDEKEFTLLGPSSRQLAYGLASGGDYDLFKFVMSLAPGPPATTERDGDEKFFIGRMILRQAKDELGVHPGEEEISAYLRKLKVFAGPDQKFDPEVYRTFVEKGMGRLGLMEKNLRDLAADILAAQKITTIVSGGLSVDQGIAKQGLALDNQQITGESAKMVLAPFLEKIKPTEEEVKKYWETLSDSFTTEARRKFTYVVVTPKMPEEPKVEETPETIVDAAATEEQKKEATAKKDAEKAKRTAEYAELRRTTQLKVDGEVSSFLDKLEDQKGAGFEESAKQYGWEVKTSEFFARSIPPSDLDLPLRSSSTGGKTVDQLFLIQETSDPISKISKAFAVGENQWIVARIDGEEKSRTKTYEEASVEARSKYISEKATEAMKAAANEAATKIKTLVAAGKTFAEAAKEAGIPETKAFTAVTSSYRPDAASEPSNLFESVRNTDPGSIADVITQADQSFILHIAKREVLKEPNAATRIDSEVRSRTEQNELLAFGAWLTGRMEDARVQQMDGR